MHLPRRCPGRWLGWALSVVFLLVLVAPAVAKSQEASPPAGAAVERAATWLLAQQAPDGGFVGFSGSSDAGVTADAVVALVAAQNVGVRIDLARAAAYLEEHALTYAQTGPGQAAKLTLAAVALGHDPRDFAKVNPLSIVEASAESQGGLIGSGIFDHALGILALTGAGAAVPASALEVLRGAQIEDGSWAFDGSTEPGAGDTNTTALVIQALAAAGHGDDPMVERALRYLKAAQTEAGGFPYQPGEAAVADANSTALAVQAVIAAGEDPASDDWKDAAGALAAFQNPSGAFRYTDDQPDDNLFATLQALPALAGQPLPIRPAPGPGVGVATPAAGA